MKPYEIVDKDGTLRVRFRRLKDGEPFVPPSERAYWTSGQMVRFINGQCLNTRALHAERLKTPGPAIIAVTHLSHLEPLILSVNAAPAIHWMTRIEFYKKRWARFLLQTHLTFAVHRQGQCLGTMRYALNLLRAGKTVGIFPEGGVAQGEQAAIRGGPIKLGACLLAWRARAPIVPVVVVGTHKLNAVPPWLPVRRGHVWLAAGEPIRPEADTAHPRRARHELGRRLSEAFQTLYRELLEKTDLHPELAP